MTARILQFRAPSRESVPVPTLGLSDVMAWVRTVFHEIVDGPMPETITAGDAVVLRKVSGLLADHEDSKPFSTKQLRVALWSLDALLIARDRIRAAL